MIFAGCSTKQGNQLEKQNSSPRIRPYVVRNLATVPNQKLPPDNIRSITFYKLQDPGGAPIIRLKSDDQLELQFDDMSSDANMYTVKITHQNEDWSRSNL
ncbi:MAG TPA: type IX secretion system plug protein domain-containing protein, partial [Balneolales bacterium]|nr:type IX secretion system plug protein domain-containing protein [Balneolales bacterium]